MAARECKHDATARRARRGFFRAIRRHRSPTVATGRDTSQSAWQRRPCIDRSNRPVSSTDYRDALRRLPGLFIADTAVNASMIAARTSLTRARRSAIRIAG